jgi:hypothetical protein
MSGYKSKFEAVLWYRVFIFTTGRNIIGIPLLKLEILIFHKCTQLKPDRISI